MFGCLVDPSLHQAEFLLSPNCVQCEISGGLQSCRVEIIVGM